MKRVIPKQFTVKLGRKNNNDKKTSNTIDMLQQRNKDKIDIRFLIGNNISKNTVGKY